MRDLFSYILPHPHNARKTCGQQVADAYKPGELKRYELGGQRGLTLKLQSWRPLLLDAEGIEHFLYSMAFGRCCASSQRKLCARVKGQQEQPCVSCCHEKAPPLVSQSGQRAWVLKERS